MLTCICQDSTIKNSLRVTRNDHILEYVECAACGTYRMVNSPPAADMIGYYNNEKIGRTLLYTAAIREALELALTHDERVFVMGQGVDDPAWMFGITLDLHKKY